MAMFFGSSVFVFGAIILSLIVLANGSKIALVPSSGCYSHDVMMREVGFEFPEDNKTWVQIYMYEFGFGSIQLPDSWERLLVNRVTDEANAMQQVGSALLWEMIIPFDRSRPWDLRGTEVFIKILENSFGECARLLKSGDFYKYAANQKDVDLVVVDHFLQECVTAMASLLNATTVQFSNWPISDGYVTSLNIPSNPSYVTKTGTIFPGNGMSFLERAMNTVYNALIVLARYLQMFLIQSFYSSIGHPNIDMNAIEAGHLFYAGRSEFLAEPIRPLNNRIKHFGCAACKPMEEYVIARPDSVEVRSTDGEVSKKDHSDRLGGLSLLATNGSVVDCSPKLKTSNIVLEGAVLSGGVNRTVLEERYIKTQLEYPELDFSELESKKFILVSFGSVAKVNYMKPELLQKFFKEFEKLDRLVVWATNSAPSDFLKESDKVPENVRLLQWAPIKVLLAHHNLDFVFCHGGINTLNEIFHFGVPVLGLPLQGDQPSNLNRMRELGIGELVEISEIWDDKLGDKLSKMVTNLPRYTHRAQLVGSMVTAHRQLAPNRQNFWLHWAKRHGARIKGSAAGQKLFEFFYRPLWEHFALLEVAFWGTIIMGLIRIISL